MRTLPFSAAAALLISACEAAPRTPPPADVRPAAVLPSPPLRMDLVAPAEVRQGDLVPLRLTARNTGGRPLRLEMGDSAYSFDFVVTGPGGGESWSRMHDIEAIPLALHERQLPPGGEIVFTDNWDLRDNRGHPVPPGRYTLHALLDADTMPHRMLKTPGQTVIVAPRPAVAAPRSARGGGGLQVGDGSTGVRRPAHHQQRGTN